MAYHIISTFVPGTHGILRWKPIWDNCYLLEAESVFPGLFNSPLLGDLNSSHPYVPITVWKKYVGNYE